MSSGCSRSVGTNHAALPRHVSTPFKMSSTGISCIWFPVDVADISCQSEVVRTWPGLFVAEGWIRPALWQNAARCQMRFYSVDRHCPTHF